MDKLFDRFVEFSIEHYTSKDIDPVYPLIKEVNRVEGIGIEQALWRLLLYVTWYRLGSSEQVYAKHPNETEINEIFIMKTGIERRGFRGNNKGVEMINDFLRVNGSMWGYLEKIANVSGKDGWRFIREDFEAIKWNGNWASYKWADLMKNVMDLPITAPNIGGEKAEKHSPVTCLHTILKEFDEEMPYANVKDENLQQSFFDACVKQGAIFQSIDQMETSLCDFKNHIQGKYEVGHDIRLLRLELPELPKIFSDVFYDIFEPKYYEESSTH